LGLKAEKYAGGHRTIGEIKNTRRNIGDTKEITCPVLGNLPEKWEKMPEEW